MFCVKEELLGRFETQLWEQLRSKAVSNFISVEKQLNKCFREQLSGVEMRVFTNTSRR